MGLRRPRSALLRIPLDEVSFARRGFWAGTDHARQQLEESGRSFLAGYHAALSDAAPSALALRLHAVASDFRGFAFEGAAMGLALLDALSPWRLRRVGVFIAGPGDPHRYMAHVGIGWAVARLPWLRWRIDKELARLDPLLRWLAVDGYGFHEGYFRPAHAARGERARPRGLEGYARRAFDQGLGRSLWFVESGDVARISAAIAVFPQDRRADLWSGIGLASAYAGGVDADSLRHLRLHAKDYAGHMAQGVAFAAKARSRAGNPTAHTERACRILAGVSADEAAAMTDHALEDLPPDRAEPAYEIWRRRIQLAFDRHEVVG